MSDVRCINCRFHEEREDPYSYEYLAHYCKFYPKEIVTHSENWCGQFQEKSSERSEK